MSHRVRIFFGIVLAAFVAEAAVVVSMMGLGGVFAAATANPTTNLMLLETTICLALICTWMWRDARERQANPVPYVVLTVLTGVVGPLLYLARRGEARESVHAPAPQREAQPA